MSLKECPLVSTTEEQARALQAQKVAEGESLRVGKLVYLAGNGWVRLARVRGGETSLRRVSRKWHHRPSPVHLHVSSRGLFRSNQPPSIDTRSLAYPVHHRKLLCYRARWCSHLWSSAPIINSPFLQRGQTLVSDIAYQTKHQAPLRIRTLRGSRRLP